MSARRRRALVLAAGVAALGLTGHKAEGAVYSWIGGDGVLNTAGNWSPSGPPTSATADTANFGSSGATTLTQTAALSVQNINFNSDANANTWNLSNFGITMGNGTTTRGSILNNSSNTQIFNTGATGVLGINGFIGPSTGIGGSGDIVINGNVNVGNGGANNNAWLDFTNSGNVYINVDTSINANGSASPAAWSAGAGNGNASRGNVFFEGSGNVYFGNIGTAYQGSFILQGTGNQNVILTHNNALGRASNGTTNYRVNITGGTTGNDTLQLQGGISVSKYTFNFDGRSGGVATDPHIENLSGNNTIFVVQDMNSITNGVSGNWNWQSDAGKLTIANGNIYNTGNANATTLQLSGAGDGQIDGSLVTWTNNSPSLQVVKSGTGTWTFTKIPGANETTFLGDTVVATPTLNKVSIFTGSFNVNAGTLQFKPTSTISLPSTSAINVADGAKLAVTSFNSTSTTLSTASTLTLGVTTGGSLNMTLAGNPTAAPLVVSASNSFITHGTNLINVSSTGALTLGSFTLIDYAGTIGGSGFGGLTLGTLPPRVVANLVNNTGNTSVDLNITAIDTIRWNGGVNGTWDINNTTNWKTVLGNAVTTYLQPTVPGDTVTFDDNAVGNFTVNIAAGGVNPALVTFNNSSNNYSITGASLTTSGSLTKNGSGNATLANSFTSVATLSMAGSGNLTVAAGNFTAGNVTFGGTGSLTFSNSGSVLSLPSTLALNSGVLDISRTDDLTFSNVLTGSGKFRKSNTNTLTLTGNNAAFNGAIEVGGGTLKIGNASAYGTTTGGTSVLSGGALDLNGISTGSETITIAGSGVGGTGALVNSTTTVVNVLNLALSGNATIGSTTAGMNIGGTGGSFAGNSHDLTKVGNGIESDIIGVGETNLANVNVAGGYLYIAGNTTLGAPAGVVTVSNNGMLGFYGDLDSATNISTAAVTKPMVVPDSTAGGIVLWNGNKTIDSTTITIGSGSTFDVTTYPRSNNTTATATLTGKITGTGNLAAHINASTASSRRGMVVLTSDNNDYSGQTIIGGGGGLVSSNSNNDRMTLSVGNGGSTGKLGTGEVVIGSRGTLLFNRTGTLGVPNTISGSGSVAHSGTGVTTLSGNNSYSGTTAINAGQLEITNNNALGAGGNFNASWTEPSGGSSTGALVLSNNINSGEFIWLGGRTAFNPHIINKSGSNTLSGTVLLDVDTTLPPNTHYLYAIQSDGTAPGDLLTLTDTIRTPSTSEITTSPYNAAGAVSGTISLQGAGNGRISGNIDENNSNIITIEKNGSGTWTLEQFNFFHGNTTINTGTLAVTTSDAMHYSPVVWVKSGAYLDATGAGGYSLPETQVLKGAGNVIGSVSVDSNRTISPGDGGTGVTGVFNISAGLTLNNDAALQYDLDTTPAGSNDRIDVGGNLSLNGDIKINITKLGTALGSGTYRLINYSGTLSGSPTFTLAGLTGTATRQNFTVDTSIAHQLNLNVIGAPATLTWTGNTSNDWDVFSTSGNWVGAADTRFYDGDLVTFNDTGAAHSAVNVQGTVSPAQVTFSNTATHDYTLTGGNINVVGSLFASNGGSVTLNTTNVAVGGALTASGSGNLTVNPSGNGTFGSVSASGGGTLTINPGGVASITSDVTASGAVSVILNPGNNLTVGGSFSSTSSGNTTINPGGNATIAGNFSSGGSGNITINPSGATAITGNFSSTGSGNVTVAGGDFAVTGTFTQAGTGVVSIANSNRALSLPASVAVSSGVLELNRTDDLTVANSFNGGGTLRKANINTVTISANNSGFSGTIAVTGGTLKVGNVNALGSATAGVTVSSGATLDLNGIAVNGGSATLAGDGVSGIGALYNGTTGTTSASSGLIQNITLAADTTIGTNGNNGYNIGANFGSATLGSGSFVGNNHNLNVVIGHECDIKNVGDMGVNNISVTGGPLYFAGNTTLGSTSGLLTLQDTGRLGFYGNDNINGTDSTTGVIDKPMAVASNALSGFEIYRGNMAISAPITLNTNGTLVVENYHRDGNGVNWATTLSGKITGAGNLAVHVNNNTTVVSRAGTVLLTSDDNDYTGTTVIGGGGGFNNAAASRDRITLSVGNGGSTGKLGTGDVTVNATATLLFNRTTALSVPANISILSSSGIASGVLSNGNIGAITLGGTISNAGTINTVGGGNLTMSGTINNTGTITNNGGGNMLISGPITNAGSINTSGTSNTTITGDVNVSGGTISNLGSGVVTVSGNISGGGARPVVGRAGNTGGIVLSGSNSYTGLTLMTNGPLTISNSNALGAPGTITDSYTELNNTVNTANDLTAVLILNNNITVNEAVIYLGAPRSTNAANAGFGPQIVSASGNNELTGILAPDGTPDATYKYFTVQSNSNANLKLSGNIVQDHAGEAILTLRGAGTGEVSGQILEPTANIFDNTPVTGNKWSLIKEGSGTWKLTGNNPYTGTTTINNGTLLVNGHNTGTGAITVAAGALGGTGSVAAPITVQANAAISPGNSAGQFTTSSNLSIAANGAMVWQLAALSTSNPGTDFDQMVVGGNLTLDVASALGVDFSLLPSNQQPNGGDGYWASNHSWKIVDITGSNVNNSGFGSITGTPSGSPGSFSTSVGGGADAGDVFLNWIASVVTTYTAGDANHDGHVNTLDFNQLATTFNTTGATPWSNTGGPTTADFNGDGKINALDFNILAINWGSGGLAPVASGAALGSVVPEPASLGLLALAAGSMMTRRRRGKASR